jgi:hypothetical protein
MPDDVAARLDTALRSAPPLPTASGGATVLPIDAARDKQLRRQAWSGRALGVAAGFAALLVVSGVVVSQLRSGSGSGADLAAGAPQVQTLAVVSSDMNYTPEELPQQLNTVLASSATELGSAAATPTSPPVEVNVEDAPSRYTATLQQCVSGLTEGGTTAPLMADYASFQRRPVLLVAVPDPLVVGKIDVFVVDRACTGGPDVRLFFYRVVEVADLPALAGVTLPSPTATP